LFKALKAFTQYDQPPRVQAISQILINQSSET